MIRCVMALLMGASASAQQQLVDPDFHASVEKPAYLRDGPTVAIDEAHANFHTATGQYAPFAALLRSDGYRVVSSTSEFKPTTLAGVRVLVIANARNMAALLAGDISKPALTEDECEVVSGWVRDGGSLLLIADHAPYGNAVDNLAKRFDVSMGKGWAFDRAPTGGITTQLVFSRENGLLGNHPILMGRDSAETVNHIRSFTGQSLGAPSGASVLMKLAATAREAPTPADLDAEDAAARSTDAVKAIGAHSNPAGGRAQGLAMPFGKGRLVVLGEAALLSAQILRFTDGNLQRDTKFGMNAPGTDDRQFAINVLHWLSRLLP
jgi:hypothetical protein